MNLFSAKNNTGKHLFTKKEIYLPKTHILASAYHYCQRCQDSVVLIKKLHKQTNFKPAKINGEYSKSHYVIKYLYTKGFFSLNMFQQM